MRKINSNSYGGIWLGVGLLIGLVLPIVLWLTRHILSVGLIALGSGIVLSFFVLLRIEMHQDNGKVPFYEKHLSREIPFDPVRQEAVIRCSICSGERIAGFMDKEDGHFTEVMVLKTTDDEKRFKRLYGIENVKSVY